MIALYIILSIILLIFILLHFSIVLHVDYTKENFNVKAKYLFFTIYPLKEKKPNKKKKKRKTKGRLSKRKKKKLQEELAKEKSEYEALLKKVKSEQIDVDTTKIEENKLSNEDNQSNEKSEDTQNTVLEEEPIRKKGGKTKKDKKIEIAANKLEEAKEKWEKIKPYVPVGRKVVRKLIKAIRISDLKIEIIVADEDAYECALSFGKVNAIVSSIVGVLASFFTLSIKKINIKPKFNSSEGDYAFSCNIKTRPSALLAIGVFILFKFIYTNLKIRKQENKEMEM